MVLLTGRDPVRLLDLRRSGNAGLALESPPFLVLGLPCRPPGGLLGLKLDHALVLGSIEGSGMIWRLKIISFSSHLATTTGPQ